MTSPVSTPTLDQQNLMKDTFNSYPTDMGKALFENWIDGEDISFTYTSKALGRPSRQITGTVVQATPWKTLKSNSKDIALNFFMKFTYSELGEVGQTMKSVHECYDFLNDWYGVLKFARLLTVGALGPGALIFGAIEAYLLVSGAWDDAHEWYDNLGLEEHQSQGRHLLQLNKFHTKNVENIYAAIEQSWSLPTASMMKATWESQDTILSRVPPSRQDDQIFKLMRASIDNAFDNASKHSRMQYRAQLQVMAGILMQAETLRMTLDRIIKDCDRNPLSYWGCSFDSGYKNPGPGFAGELLNSQTISFVLLQKEVKDYKLSNKFDADLTEYVNKTLGDISLNVRGKAIALANQLDLKHLPALRERAKQMIHELD